MPSLGSVMGLPLNMEILLFAIVGIVYTSFDTSIFNLHANLKEIWSVAIPETSLSTEMQNPMRILLTTIVIIRSCTSHLHLACYIIMLYPILCSERPSLLLPWLVVGAIKQILMSLLSLGTGLVVCASMNHIKEACAYFVAARFIELSPALYMWSLVYSLYREIKAEIDSKAQHDMNPAEALEQLVRRRRARLKAKEGVEKPPPPCMVTRTYISESRSLDALMSHIPSGVDVTVYPEMSSLTPAQKTQHMLGLTDAEVSRARRAVPHARSAETLLVVGPNASSAHDDGKVCPEKEEKVLAVVNACDNAAVRKTRFADCNSVILTYSDSNSSKNSMTDSSCSSFAQSTSTISTFEQSKNNSDAATTQTIILSSRSGKMRYVIVPELTCSSKTHKEKLHNLEQKNKKNVGNSLHEVCGEVQTDSEEFLRGRPHRKGTSGSMFLRLLRRNTRLSITPSSGQDHHALCSKTTILTMQCDGSICFLETDSCSSAISFVSARSNLSLEVFSLIDVKTKSFQEHDAPFTSLLNHAIDLNDSSNTVGNRVILHLTSAVVMRAAQCMSMARLAWNSLLGLNPSLLYNAAVPSINIFEQRNYLIEKDEQGCSFPLHGRDKKNSNESVFSIEEISNTSIQMEDSESENEPNSSKAHTNCTANKAMQYYMTQGRKKNHDGHDTPNEDNADDSDEDDSSLEQTIDKVLIQLRNEICSDTKKTIKQYCHCGQILLKKKDDDAFKNVCIGNALNQMRKECQKCNKMLDREEIALSRDINETMEKLMQEFDGGTEHGIDSRIYISVSETKSSINLSEESESYTIIATEVRKQGPELKAMNIDLTQESKRKSTSKDIIQENSNVSTVALDITQERTQLDDATKVSVSLTEEQKICSAIIATEIERLTYESKTGSKDVSLEDIIQTSSKLDLTITSSTEINNVPETSYTVLATETKKQTHNPEAASQDVIKEIFTPRSSIIDIPEEIPEADAELKDISHKTIKLDTLAKDLARETPNSSAPRKEKTHKEITKDITKEGSEIVPTKKHTSHESSKVVAGPSPKDVTQKSIKLESVNSKDVIDAKYITQQGSISIIAGNVPNRTEAYKEHETKDITRRRSSIIDIPEESPEADAELKDISHKTIKLDTIAKDLARETPNSSAPRKEKTHKEITKDITKEGSEIVPTKKHTSHESSKVVASPSPKDVTQKSIKLESVTKDITLENSKGVIDAKYITQQGSISIIAGNVPNRTEAYKEHETKDITRRSTKASSDTNVVTYTGMKSETQTKDITQESLKVDLTTKDASYESSKLSATTKDITHKGTNLERTSKDIIQESSKIVPTKEITNGRSKQDATTQDIPKLAAVKIDIAEISSEEEIDSEVTRRSVKDSTQCKDVIEKDTKLETILSEPIAEAKMITAKDAMLLETPQAETSRHETVDEDATSDIIVSIEPDRTPMSDLKEGFKRFSLALFGRNVEPEQTKEKKIEKKDMLQDTETYTKPELTVVDDSNSSPETMKKGGKKYESTVADKSFEEELNNFMKKYEPPDMEDVQSRGSVLTHASQKTFSIPETETSQDDSLTYLSTGVQASLMDRSSNETSEESYDEGISSHQLQNIEEEELVLKLSKDEIPSRKMYAKQKYTDLFKTMKPKALSKDQSTNTAPVHMRRKSVKLNPVKFAEPPPPESEREPIKDNERKFQLNFPIPDTGNKFISTHFKEPFIVLSNIGSANSTHDKESSNNVRHISRKSRKPVISFVDSEKGNNNPETKSKSQNTLGNSSKKKDIPDTFAGYALVANKFPDVQNTSQTTPNIKCDTDAEDALWRTMSAKSKSMKDCKDECKRMYKYLKRKNEFEAVKENLKQYAQKTSSAEHNQPMSNKLHSKSYTSNKSKRGSNIELSKSTPLENLAISDEDALKVKHAKGSVNIRDNYLHISNSEKEVYNDDDTIICVFGSNREHLAKNTCPVDSKVESCEPKTSDESIFMSSISFNSTIPKNCSNISTKPVVTPTQSIVESEVSEGIDFDIEIIKAPILPVVKAETGAQASTLSTQFLRSSEKCNTPKYDLVAEVWRAHRRLYMRKNC